MGRPWGEKFRDAAHGIRLGIRRQSSFRVHLAVALVVIGLAAILRCDRLDWCLLLGCIGAVWSLELLNSAIEEMFHGLDATAKARISGCLDTAAGAVLVAALFSAIIGCMILIPKMVALIQQVNAQSLPG